MDKMRLLELEQLVESVYYDGQLCRYCKGRLNGERETTESGRGFCHACMNHGGVATEFEYDENYDAEEGKDD